MDVSILSFETGPLMGGELRPYEFWLNMGLARRVPGKAPTLYVADQKAPCSIQGKAIFKMLRKVGVAVELRKD